MIVLMRTVRVPNAGSENRKWLFEDSFGGNFKQYGGRVTTLWGKIVRTQCQRALGSYQPWTPSRSKTPENLSYLAPQSLAKDQSTDAETLTSFLLFEKQVQTVGPQEGSPLIRAQVTGLGGGYVPQAACTEMVRVGGQYILVFFTVLTLTSKSPSFWDHPQSQADAIVGHYSKPPQGMWVELDGVIYNGCRIVSELERNTRILQRWYVGDHACQRPTGN